MIILVLVYAKIYQYIKHKSHYLVKIQGEVCMIVFENDSIIQLNRQQQHNHKGGGPEEKRKKGKAKRGLLSFFLRWRNIERSFFLGVMHS